MLSNVNRHFFKDHDHPIIQQFIYINGEITIQNCSEAIGKIIEYNQPSVGKDEEGVWFEEPETDVINLLITSPGGDMSAAFALINIIRGSKIPVRTIALGEAISAGFFILIAGHQRVVTPYTSLMSHVFRTGVDGSYHEISNAMKDIHRYNDKMVEYCYNMTQVDRKIIRKKFLGKEDYYLSFDDVLKYNMIDLVSDLS